MYICSDIKCENGQFFSNEDEHEAILQCADVCHFVR